MKHTCNWLKNSKLAPLLEDMRTAMHSKTVLIDDFQKFVSGLVPETQGCFGKAKTSD